MEITKIDGKRIPLLSSARNNALTNYHNPIQLAILKANCDIRLILTRGDYIEYIRKYCTKSEQLGESFPEIVRSITTRSLEQGNGNPFLVITNALLRLQGNRTISQQEASLLLSNDGKLWETSFFYELVDLGDTRPIKATIIERIRNSNIISTNSHLTQVNIDNSLPVSGPLLISESASTEISPLSINTQNLNSLHPNFQDITFGLLSSPITPSPEPLELDNHPVDTNRILESMLALFSHKFRQFSSGRRFYPFSTIVNFSIICPKLIILSLVGR